MNNKVIKTNYGYDLIWAETDSYCGKILVFEKQGGKLGLHFHKNKSKSWFVNSGKFKVQWIDTKTGKSYATELSEGNVFHISPLTPVELECLIPNSSMAETSNQDDIDDMYRLN